MNRFNSVKTLEDIINILQKNKDHIVQKYKPKEIGVFGSFVRGEQKKGSDVDILVEFDENDLPDLLDFIAMEEYIRKLLKKKVDLVRKEALRQELKDRILKEVVYI